MPHKTISFGLRKKTLEKEKKQQMQYKAVGFLVIVSFLGNIFCPVSAFSSGYNTEVLVKPKNGYPSSQPKFTVFQTIYVTATSYSSTVDQCDGDPCTTASGMNVCERNKEDVIAANFLPFGTKVRFPELFGTKVFTVQDRMNPRYRNRIDFWFKTRQKAKMFGKRTVKMEILLQEN